jgi:hypothetical protein
MNKTIKNENEIIIILKALKDLNVEKDEILNYLCGKSTRKIILHKLNLDPYFGVFSHKQRSEIEKIISFAEELL